MIYENSSMYDPSSGSVTIDMRDIINKRCSGILNFTIGDEFFAKGKFSVPIYNV